jgi:hypothetical protein
MGMWLQRIGASHAHQARVPWQVRVEGVDFLDAEVAEHERGTIGSHTRPTNPIPARVTVDCDSLSPTLLLGTGVTLANPKSRTLACPRLVTKMLAGLMSRWTMPAEWAGSSASCNFDSEGQNQFGV